MNKKITIVSTSDRGGAGRAATRLHKGLLEIGADSNILYLIQYDKSTPNSHEYISENGKINELIRKAKLGLRYYTNKLSLIGREFDQEIFTYIDTPFDISNHKLIKNSDVINLHWVSHFLDWASFFKKVDKPIYWTLHDQNVFTGGCHYSFGCYKYENTCSECHQLKGAYFNNSSLKQQSKKIELIQNNENIFIVTPSKWLGSLSQKSKVFSNKKHYIVQYGLETEKFKRYNHEEVRKELGIPNDKKVLLFVADHINKIHKGFGILQKALLQLNRNDYTLVSIGNGKISSDIKNHINLGFIKSTDMLSKIYSAADVFVMPSTMDNFPNTILESKLVGTPVIGFALTGVEEMIKHNFSGVLCETADSTELKKAINSFLDDEYNFDNQKIRERSLNHFTLERMAKEYADIMGLIDD